MLTSLARALPRTLLTRALYLPHGPETFSLLYPECIQVRFAIVFVGGGGGEQNLTKN